MNGLILLLLAILCLIAAKWPTVGLSILGGVLVLAGLFKMLVARP